MADIGTLTASLGIDTKGLKDAEDEFNKFGNNLGKRATKVGKNLSLKLTAPLLLLGGIAAKTAIDFESAFTGVRKTVDATEKQFAELEKELKSLALEIPLSTEELFGLGEAAGQLGIKQEDILGFTKVMADLGSTTNLAANEAATSLARFANITGLAADDYDRLGSTIVDLGNNLATTEAEIVEMSLRLAGAGKTIGLTQDQILSLAGALSSVGIRAEAGGTAFSRVMKEIAKEVGTGSDAIQRFAEISGKSVGEFEKQWKENAAEAIISFTEGLGKIQESGKNVNLVLDELGFSNIRISDALLRAAGSGDLFRTALELGNKAWEENTALTKEANLRYKTSAAQLKIAKNQVAQLAESFGKVFVPALLDVVKFLKPIITWLENLDKTTKIVIISIAALTAIIGPLLIALGSMVTAIKALAVAKIVLEAISLAFTGSLFVAITALSPAIIALVGTFGLLLGFAAQNWWSDWVNGLGQIQKQIKEIEKEHTILDKRLSKKLSALGFTDIEKFNKAVKSGLVVYNEALGVWEKTADVIKKSMEERTKAEKEAAEVSEKLSKAQQEAIDETVKSLQDYARTIDTLGDKFLAISKTRFSDELKTENITIASLNASMRRYRAVIEETFSSRQNLHQILIDELDFQKAKQDEITAAEIAAAQSQLARNELLLKSHRDFFSALSSMRDKSIKDQKKKIQELAAFEKTILQQNKTFIDLISELELKIIPDERNEVEKFYAKQIELENKLSEIQELSGKKKLDALEAFAKEAAAQAKEVVGEQFGVKTTIPLKEASEAVLELVKRAQEAFNEEAETIKQAKQTEIEAAKNFQEELKTSMDAAIEDIHFFEDEILAVAQNIEQLQVLVSLDDQATVGIQAIQAELDALQDKTITITTIHKTEFEGATSSLPVFHNGIASVPKTGPAIVERGEMIIPANQNPFNANNSFDQRQSLTVNNFDRPKNRTEEAFNMRQMMSGRRVSLAK